MLISLLDSLGKKKEVLLGNLCHMNYFIFAVVV